MERKFRRLYLVHSLPLAQIFVQTKGGDRCKNETKIPHPDSFRVTAPLSLFLAFTCSSVHSRDNEGKT